MSLMQVLTRDSLQSTTTPYAFLGSSAFIQESRDNCMPASSGSLYFPASRERNIPASDASTAVVGGEGIQQHYLSSTGTEENLKLSNTSGNQLKEKAAEEWGDTSTQSTVPQHTMNNLQHVAQQSRREKLRIPGSLQHPASPQSGNHSDHSAGSALVLEMRQGASGLHQAQHPENMESPGNLRGYAGNSNQPVGDMLSVYNNQMLASELYNFSTGAELLSAVSGKNQGYLCVSGTDGMPQAPGLVSSVYPGQGGFSSQGNGMPKGGNWSSINGQLGQFSTNSLNIVPPNALQGSSGTSGGAAPSGIPATLLVGSGLQPSSFGSTGRDVGTYFTGPNAQEAMQLYLMNAAGYAAYPDGSSPGNMVFIGPSNGGGLTNQLAGGHAGGAQSQQHLIGIPLHSSQQNSLSQNSQVTSVSNSPVGYQSGGRGGGTQTYTSWKNGDELLFMPASERAKSFNNNQEGNSVGLSHSVNDFSEYGMREASMGGAGQQQHLHVENSQASAAGYQSLSLSLSSQQPQSLHGYDVLHQSGLDSPAALSQDSKRPGQIGNKLAGDLSHFRRDYGGGTKHMNMDTGSSAMSASFSIISSSRYLKACQQLLEEVCSVGRGVKQSMNRSSSQGWAGPSPPLTSPTSANKDGAIQEHSAGKDGGAGTTTTTNTSVSAGGGGTSAGISPGATATASGTAPATSANEGGESASTLTTEERQEYEMKKSKLVAMLQEVDRRYRQYYDQMQVVISSFDAVAGVGAATPYTALALQAMSRYFRCLKDAITGQIQIVCKSLGEEDISKQLTSKGPTSRLRFIDQQLRQQRAFQQLGMLNQHAWRPQRGLPERSVSILRAWLFEHFLHPYPKDADKMMLARQTGLTRSQVSNWFINARVRLWKPMVEEMYQEETREHELNVGASRMHADNDDFRDGSGDVRGDKSGKGGGEQGTGADSKSKGEGSQDYIPDDGSQDYIPGSAIRKQSLGAMADSQMYDEAENDGLRQAQLKKSRFGVHDPTDMLMPSNANMDVDLKTESNDGMPESEHKFGNEGIANGALHHHHQSFGGYDGNLRFANGGGFPSRYNPGSGVSLTLGLQHSDSLSLSGAQQAYLHGGQGFAMSRRENVGAAEHDYSSLYENAAAGLSSGHLGGHENINYSSRKHMESQLLHDFVA